MKISKHIHSCLLVEDQDKTILLDPGNYSYDEKALDLNSIPNIDVVGITHKHMDHMHLPFIKEIIAKFPNVQFFSNESIKEILGKEGINVNTQGNEFLKMELIPHEKIWMAKTPAQNVMITLFRKFATPGDSLTFDLNRHSGRLKGDPESPNKDEEILNQVQDDGEVGILALPIQAPWGSTTWAVDVALKVKPKVIIPIHDWHWKDIARKAFYERLEQYFAQSGIKFLKMETNEVFEV